MTTIQKIEKLIGGLKRAEKAQVLAFAVSDNRILITLNRLHFIRLHKKKPKHKVIIVCSLDLDFSALADRINRALREESTFDGKLLRINRPN